MLYVDTSILVAALTSEAETHRMQEWLTSHSIDEMAISNWTITEFSAALSLKLRSGQLELSQRNRCLAAFGRLAAESFHVLAVTASHFKTAALLADQHGSGLRAGDALHLAVAIEHGAQLCTLDRKLAQAGAELGANTALL